MFVRDAACREALDAVRAMRAVDAKYPVRMCSYSVVRGGVYRYSQLVRSPV